jgi:hypothetical protein
MIRWHSLSLYGLFGSSAEVVLGQISQLLLSNAAARPLPLDKAIELAAGPANHWPLLHARANPPGIAPLGKLRGKCGKRQTMPFWSLFHYPTTSSRRTLQNRCTASIQQLFHCQVHRLTWHRGAGFPRAWIRSWVQWLSSSQRCYTSTTTLRVGYGPSRCVPTRLRVACRVEDRSSS